MISRESLFGPVEALGLSHPVRSNVRLMQACRLGDLCVLRPAELWPWGPSREASAEEIRVGLAPYGLALRREPTPEPSDRGPLDDLLLQYEAALRAGLGREAERDLAVPVSVLGLGERATAWLRSNYLYTVRRLVDGGVEQLWWLYNCMQREAEEVVPFGSAFEHSPESLERHEEFVMAIARRLGSFGLELERGSPWHAADPDRIRSAGDDLVRRGIGVLGLRERTLAYLRAAGIRTVSDLVARSGGGLRRELPGPPEDQVAVDAALASVGL